MKAIDFENATAFDEFEYSALVSRMEVFTVSKRELALETDFQHGKSDRLAGKPCASAGGAYLNGWYSPEVEFYYIPKAAAEIFKAYSESLNPLTH
jgi:hypothetical protein